MKTFLSILWGMLTAWTVVSAFTDLTMIGICRLFAITAVIGLCIYRNTIPDAKEWTILILSAVIIAGLWQLVPGVPLSVVLKNSHIREFTLCGSVILSLTMSNDQRDDLNRATGRLVFFYIFQIKKQLSYLLQDNCSFLFLYSISCIFFIT